MADHNEVFRYETLSLNQLVPGGRAPNTATKRRGNTVARRASGATVGLRAASETNSTPRSEPWVSHLRQILVTLCCQ
jgi:hypothetical protein